MIQITPRCRSDFALPCGQKNIGYSPWNPIDVALRRIFFYSFLLQHLSFLVAESASLIGWRHLPYRGPGQDGFQLVLHRRSISSQRCLGRALSRLSGTSIFIYCLHLGYANKALHLGYANKARMNDCVSDSNISKFYNSIHRNAYKKLYHAYRNAISSGPTCQHLYKWTWRGCWCEVTWTA